MTFDLAGHVDAVDRHGRVWVMDPDHDGCWRMNVGGEYTTLAGQRLLDHHGPLSPVVHVLYEPPAETPPDPVCGTCGGTGEMHGSGGNGNWLGVPCGCETRYCAGCGDPWPCYGAPKELPGQDAVPAGGQS